MSAAFQHMVTLLSFVLALGVSHQLLTVVEIVRAGPRVKLSFVHALWMVNGFLAVVLWWTGIWDLRSIRDWPVISVLPNFGGAVCVFLSIAFACPRIPEDGAIDLAAFHDKHRRKYAAFFLVSTIIAIADSLYYGDVLNVPGQNLEAGILLFMALAALAAIFLSNPTVQRLAAIASVAGSTLFLLIGDPVLRSG
jgi:hypothetical protein